MKRAFKWVYVAFNFLGLTGGDLTDFAEGTVSKIDGNPDIPTPDKPIIDATKEINNLKATRVLRQTDRSSSLQQTEEQQETLVKDTQKIYGNQVERIANGMAMGDVAIANAFIEGIGFFTRGTASKQKQTAGVEKVGFGEVTLTNEVAPDRKHAIYLWRFTINPADAASWSQAFMTSTAKVTLRGLEHEKHTWFQAAMIVTQGERNPIIDVTNYEIEWSDPFSIMVL